MEENMNPISKKIILLALALMLAGCRTFTTFSTESRPLDHQVIVDGKTEDWQGDLFVAEGERIELGFLNDRENLYVCLLTTDNFVRAQILMQGLTVWFDPKGGTNKVFGIKFPVGLPPGERKMPLGDNPEGPDLENLPKVPMTEMEIIRSEKEPIQKLNVAEAQGIEVKVVPSSGLIVYELKIPLVKTEQHPIAVGAEPGKTIGIGFETPKFDPSQMPRRRVGGIPGGGRPPMGGGAGQEGMGGYGRGFQLPEGLKMWAIVSLAQGQSGRQPELLFLSH
jgi:hypothetical protein